jgi:glycosyltransferase involved in cell wall biosynthesis
MPFFTIIIPTFNRAHTLNKALDSVAQQTFTDWECIVIDDGSTDNTKQLLSKYIANNDRFRYIFQENAERSVARNNGIRNASGKYICFLDSDDRYFKDNLENWCQFLKKNNFPKNFSYCDLIIEENNTLTKSTLPFATDNKFDFIFTNPIVPARVCLHNSLLKNTLFEEYISVGEDVTLWLKILLKTDVLYSPHFGVNYYLHEGNSINPKNPSALKMYNGFMTFFNKYPELKNKISQSLYNDYVSKIQTNIAKYHYRNGAKLKAISTLLKAIITCPIHEHTKYRIRLIVLTLFSKKPNLYD